MFLRNTFKKMEEMFATLQGEMKEVFQEDGSLKMTTGSLTVRIRNNADVEIYGPIGKLTINNREVRIKD